MQTQVLPGFRDFYPAETAFRDHIFTAWRDVARRYGFEEYDGPPLEPLDLYVKKSGAEIVGQLYAFEDKGGRQVALRPEMTPTLARMVAARANALKKPIRWFSMPQLMRYERPQRGRLREHFQLNMDIIGEAGPLADAELIAAALDVMRALGLSSKDVRVKVSDRRVVRALLDVHDLDEDQVAQAFQVIDKIDRDPREVLAERFATATGAGTQVAERVLSVGDLKGMKAVLDALGETPSGREAGEGLEKCTAALESMGLGEFVEVDLSIVRGLAYYTGIVFELFDAGKSLRAICGGGRYDGLLASLGGPDLPAVGFGMGDVVLGELLKEHEAGPPDEGLLDAFLVAVTLEEMPAVLGLAHELRDVGIRVEFGLKPQSIAKQLKLAAARRAGKAVIIGPHEREAGQAVVRNMATGEEERVALDTLVDGYDWALKG
ncbi:MAG: histidine--tRNA ligase [Gemmatimonadales bacterium]